MLLSMWASMDGLLIIISAGKYLIVNYNKFQKSY